MRKEPNKYTFATSSFGSAGHLAIELLKRDAGVDTLVDRLQGRGAGADRPHERADPADGRPDAVVAAAGAARQDQGARRSPAPSASRPRPTFRPSRNPA